MDQFVPFQPGRTINQPMVNVGRNGLRFNAKTFDILHHAVYIRVLLDTDAGKFAIQAYEKAGVDSIPFHSPKASAAKCFKINSRPFARQLRGIAGWTEGEAWNIIGRYAAGDDAIIYDLHAAFKPSGRGGWFTGQRIKDS